VPTLLVGEGELRIGLHKDFYFLESYRAAFDITRRDRQLDFVLASEDSLNV